MKFPASRRIGILGLSLLMIFSVLCQSISFASAKGISGSQLRALTDYPNWVGECGSATSTVGAIVGSTGQGANEVTTDTAQKVYLLGDSITAKSEDAYKKAFEGKNGSIDIDSSSGRSLTSGGVDGNKLSGMAAIEHDKDKIKDATTVVIALGTNGGTNKSSINKALEAIRKINNSVKLYWINTISVGRSDNYNKTVIGEANKAIQEKSDESDFEVINWFHAVDGDGDAQDPSKKEKDPNGYIDNGDRLGVHPTDKGVQSLVELVTTSIGLRAKDAPTTPDSSDSLCCDSSGATPLNGNDNMTKIYNFIIGKGLSKNQALGIMGNMKIESGFNPRSYNPSTTTDNPNPGHAFGIVQWLGGRQTALRQASERENKDITDLGLQLDFMWHELTTGSYKTSVLEPMKATDNLTEIVNIWNLHYEMSGVDPAPRVAAAHSVETDLGKSAPSSDTVTLSSSPDNACCPPTIGSSGAVADGSPSDWEKLYTGSGASKVATLAKGDLNDPKILAIHYTVGTQEGQDLLNFFAGNSEGTGIQFNVGKTGKVYQYFPLNAMKKTWHVGNANDKAIGIEITGMDVNDLINNDAQFNSVVSLAKFLCDKYKMPCSEPKGDITGTGLAGAQGMLGHDEIPENDHRDPDAKGNQSIDRTDSSSHPYMMKLRKAMGFEETPGKKGGSGSGDSTTSTGDGAGDPQCSQADTVSGSGTNKDPVGDGENKALALEAVKYDTATHPKYQYVLGGLHGPESQLEEFAKKGGNADCSGFVRYIIWKIYRNDVGSFVTQNVPNMKSVFKKIDPGEVQAGDIGWRSEHVDFITKNMGGGKLHQFGAHEPGKDLYGSDTTTGGYDAFYRYIGPKGTDE